MPSVRSLIILAVTVLVVSLVAASLSLLRTPDSGGRGRDSYGTQGYGFRAIFEVLDELDVTIDRHLPPPEPDLDAATLALLAPDARLVAVNPTYLQSLDPWVRQGGRLVVAPVPFSETFWSSSPEDRADSMTSITSILGLSDVELEMQFSLPPEQRIQRSPVDLSLDVETLTQEILEAWSREMVPPRVVEVQLDGAFGPWSEFIQRLAIPGDIHHTLSLDPDETTGTISYVDDEEERHYLAALYRRGKGDLLVVSEPELFSNRLLPLEDNSVWAAHALTAGGGRVLLDEFYHGLSVRGNPLYLFTRPGYTGAALGLLFFVIMYSWREAVLIGPALPDAIPQRRDIGEYLVAMGQLYSRGVRSRAFLVRELRAGVLRSLCLEFSLPPETHDVQQIANAIARRDIHWGERVRETIQEVDTALQSRHHWTETQTLNAMRRLTACL
jgi:hypothetical protein